jgi:anti-sigma regulatory factor (Ser/Thr protein kinase)
VRVHFTKSASDCFLRIEDEGDGFNWREYLQVDTARATHNHGRGIAMANMISFDELRYNDRGNQVTAVKRLAG